MHSNLLCMTITKTQNHRCSPDANFACRTSWTPLSLTATLVAVPASKPQPPNVARNSPGPKASCASACMVALPSLQFHRWAFLVQTALSRHSALSRRWCRQWLSPTCAADSNARELPPCMTLFSWLLDALRTPWRRRQLLAARTTPPRGIDPFLQEFLACLQRPESLLQLGAIPAAVAPAQNRAAWRRQDNQKAGEPSCLCFAHCKAESLLPALNTVDTVLQNILSQCGFSPCSWHTIADVKILEKANIFPVDKMQLIQLMCPQFWICNKHIGRASLAHAERAGAVSLFQHSSRK